MNRYYVAMEKTDTTTQCNNSQPCTPCGSASPELELPRERRRRKPWESAPLESRSNKPVVRPKIERVPRRWDRLARLVGEDGVRALLNSRVTVFGLGGVGSYAVESLARSAVGHLTIVDFDDVCVTNVNRQMQAFPSTVGQSKADLLAERIKAINPDATVDSVQAFYDPQTSESLLTPRPDFVIDAIDNVTAKLHLLATCLKSDIPVVSVAGAGAKLDPTMIRVADLSQTRVDPLARVVRKELSRRGFETTKHVGLPVVFSEEPAITPMAPSWDAEGFKCICPHAEDSPHECEKRNLIYGTASFVTATFGNAAASVVVRQIANDRVDPQG
ncbi:tRNA threonylcarbamoyladenosine dehydratase [Mariniblastus fucicola]|uniref:tRNA threonylcarbamoyladenosine dehydratase n=1 Tax=Mariniblastus fucicola TaxID=980251 RepID=A0A5B9PAE1_9BACT|nr:tRNA threonylcarbamoyladenosine dehydratase [Mariniblastus fucicola]QEG22195.1 tRNA threonylcarbamoyladenosine dehydratase [Mariniblastus fucicola]